MPQALWGQSFLEQFSYEGLRFSGIGIEVGGIMSDRLTTEITGAVRVDYGRIAPRIRVLLGASYFKGEFKDGEIREFEENLCELVALGSPCDLGIGGITWSDIEFDTDLQVIAEAGQRLAGFLGVGLGLHFMNGAGDAINGTFVEDALDRIDLGLNLSVGGQVQLTRALFLTLEARGGLATELRTASGSAGLMYRIPR